MSDNSRPILWIVLALIVIALLVWWWQARAAAKRRELDARRLDAASLRARADQNTPTVRSSSDRASVTGAIAEQAQADADAQARQAQAKADEAQRLTDEATRHQEEAAAVAAEQERLAREADRIDPDVETDDEGNRRGAGAGTTAAGAGAVAVGAAAFTQEQDEPDLADAENPFAPPQPASDAAADTADTADTADVADTGGLANPEDEAKAAADSTATAEPEGGDSGESRDIVDEDENALDSEADWVNGPIDESEEVDEAQLRADSEAADWINGPEEDEPTDAPVTGELDESAVGTAEVGSADDADWVNGPVDESAEVDEAQARDDSEAADWINGPEEGDPAPTAGAEDAVSAPDTDGAQRREFSRLDEIIDGGFGMGSAAPVFDGAQPLGHPVKAWRDTMTFVVPGGQGYDGGSPDVWFLNGEAARRAGFQGIDN